MASACIARLHRRGGTNETASSRVNRHAVAILNSAAPLALHTHKLPHAAVDLSVSTLIEFARQSLPEGRFTADDMDIIKRRWRC